MWLWLHSRRSAAERAFEEPAGHPPALAPRSPGHFLESSTALPAFPVFLFIYYSFETRQTNITLPTFSAIKKPQQPSPATLPRRSRAGRGAGSEPPPARPSLRLCCHLARAPGPGPAPRPAPALSGCAPRGTGTQCWDRAGSASPGLLPVSAPFPSGQKVAAVSPAGRKRWVWSSGLLKPPPAFRSDAGANARGGGSAERGDVAPPAGWSFNPGYSGREWSTLPGSRNK